MKPRTITEAKQIAVQKVAPHSQIDLDEYGSLIEHLAWALDQISGGDYEHTPQHDCEFQTNPEKGHCDFCWGFWAAVGACFPEKFQTDINDD